MIERAIVINGVADFAAAELLARNLDAPIFFRSAMGQLKEAQEVFVLGKTEGIPGKRVVGLSGANRFEAALNVYNLIKAGQKERAASDD